MRILPILAAATIGLFATTAFAQVVPPNFNGNGPSGKGPSAGMSGEMSGKMGHKKMTRKEMRMMKKKHGMSSKGM